MALPILALAGSWIAKRLVPRISTVVAPVATKLSTLAAPLATKVSTTVAAGSTALNAIKDKAISFVAGHAPGLVTYALPGYIVGKSSEKLEDAQDSASSFGTGILVAGAGLALYLLNLSRKDKGMVL